MPGRGKGGITGRKNRLAARLSGLLAGWPLITVAWKWKGRMRWGPSSMKRYPAKRLGYLLCETCYLLGSIENSMETASRVPFWKIIQLRISVRAKKLSGRSVFETRVCASTIQTRRKFLFFRSIVKIWSLTIQSRERREKSIRNCGWERIRNLSLIEIDNWYILSKKRKLILEKRCNIYSFFYGRSFDYR